jgi:hypothetical protein
MYGKDRCRGCALEALPQHDSSIIGHGWCRYRNCRVARLLPIVTTSICDSSIGGRICSRTRVLREVRNLHTLWSMSLVFELRSYLSLFTNLFLEA